MKVSVVGTDVLRTSSTLIPAGFCCSCCCAAVGGSDGMCAHLDARELTEGLVMIASKN